MIQQIKIYNIIEKKGIKKFILKIILKILYLIQLYITFERYSLVCNK